MHEWGSGVKDVPKGHVWRSGVKVMCEGCWKHVEVYFTLKLSSCFRSGKRIGRMQKLLNRKVNYFGLFTNDTAKVPVFCCHIFGKRKRCFLALSPPPMRLCGSRRLFISNITKARLQESAWKGNKIETRQKRAPDCSILKTCAFVANALEPTSGVAGVLRPLSISTCTWSFWTRCRLRRNRVTLSCKRTLRKLLMMSIRFSGNVSKAELVKFWWCHNPEGPWPLTFQRS